MRELDPEKMKMLEKNVRELGHIIGGVINRFCMPSSKKEYGFALMLFSYTGPELTYVSSGSRDDMRKMLQELLEHWEGGEPDTPWTDRKS